MFDLVDSLTSQTMTAIKSIITVAAAIGILVTLAKGHGIARVLITAGIAGLAVWLVAGDGITTVSQLFDSTINTEA